MPNIPKKIMQVANVWSSFFRVITNKQSAGIKVANVWKVFLKFVKLIGFRLSRKVERGRHINLQESTPRTVRAVNEPFEAMDTLKISLK